MSNKFQNIQADHKRKLNKKKKIEIIKSTLFIAYKT